MLDEYFIFSYCKLHYSLIFSVFGKKLGGGNKMIALIWVLSGMVSVCVIVMVKEFRDGE